MLVYLKQTGIYLWSRLLTIINNTHYSKKQHKKDEGWMEGETDEGRETARQQAKD